MHFSFLLSLRLVVPPSASSSVQAEHVITYAQHPGIGENLETPDPVLAERPRVEERPAVVGHLERRAGRLAEELLEGGEPARQLLVLRHDGPVLLLQIADVLGRLGEDRALLRNHCLSVFLCFLPLASLFGQEEFF